MNYETIKKISGDLIEFGLHSNSHQNYELKSPAEIETDVSECIAALEKEGCRFTRTFAYPYGRMPKSSKTRDSMKQIFKNYNIDFAVRIGSRVNKLPVRNPYELKRIGISSLDSFFEFKIKLARGSVKLF